MMCSLGVWAIVIGNKFVKQIGMRYDVHVNELTGVSEDKENLVVSLI